MKSGFFVIIALLLTLLFLNSRDTCSFAQTSGDSGSRRLVIIKGKATILNHPDLGVTPATNETLVFQKVGCDSCYIGTNVDIDGNYKISVAGGKYKIIVRNPSPEFDMLAPEQERFIDTETDSAKMYSKRVFDFDIKIRLPK
jgi:hypothetical protein